MTFLEGCTVCGSELVYTSEHETKVCFICRNKAISNVDCPKGHFICDSCHSSDANSLIEQFCVHTNLTDPIKIANLLMRQPQIKMHGPEHHFLVPAVLLASYYNFSGEDELKVRKIRSAKLRAEKVPGGFCGTHGHCGAAVGTGIVVSLITGATPLSEKEWQLSNRITGQTLLEIADKGGPRCCKRDSFIAIEKAAGFIRKHFSAELPLSPAVCEFSKRNQQCLHGGCSFYKEQ